MRVWRFIVDGFLSRHGFQICLGFWFEHKKWNRPRWLTVLLRDVMGSAFYGLSASWLGAVHCGLAKHGNVWKLENTLFLKWLWRYEG